MQYLHGVGPRLGERLGKLGIHTVRDLLWHLPVRYVDRRTIDRTGRLSVGPQRTVIAEVKAAHRGTAGRSRRPLYEVVLDDGSGPVVAKWFHFYEATMRRRFVPGQWVLVSGDVSAFGGVRQFIHPDVEAAGADTLPEDSAKILPIYPLTEGIGQRLLRTLIERAWAVCAADIEDPLPPDIIEAQHLLPRHAAFQQLHFPATDSDIAALNARRGPAHHRLIFEEMLLLELGLALRRHEQQRQPAARIPWSGGEAARFAQTLPFQLTAAQQRVLQEIAGDLARGRPMHRLLQGDVGSGKTAVAAAVAHQVIAAGWQVALMAPTEILTEQHLRSLAPWFGPLGLPHALLTGTTRTAERKNILAALGTGELPFVAGTHALIEDEIVFARLGLVIIDEQHRFGVEQRLALRTKGTAPHLLVLSATPIPRSLAMTYYGDLECSVLDELPTGRQPILTKLYRESDRAKLYAGMRQELAHGRQIYVVYPLVAESEKSDLKNATTMAQELSSVFAPTHRVALLHGRMKGEEKDAVMQSFHRGEIHVLATTSVVEVGVDVPNATVMVIEHAERFGLSQLHQLRGRVGRGSHRSYCILMTPGFVGDEAFARLRILGETNDGFRIAEEDLRLRGPGEVLGTRQSGVPDFRVARLLEDQSYFRAARQTAQDLLADDPTLTRLPTLRTAVLTHWGPRLQLAQAG